MWRLWKQRLGFRKACFLKLLFPVSAVCLIVVSSGMCRAFAAPGEEAPYAQVIRTLGDASSWQDALELLADMCEMDPRAALNTATFTAAILACGKTAQWLQVRVLLEQARRKEVKSDLGMCQAALAAYAERLAWAEALRLWEAEEPPRGLLPTVVEICAKACQAEMASQLVPQRLEDAELGRSLVTAFAEARTWEMALDVLLCMKGEGLEPTADTFADVMSACDAGSRVGWTEAESKADLERRPAQAQVMALLWRARHWGVETNARLYRTAIDACSSRLWALAVSLLVEMEADGFNPLPADLDTAIQVLAGAQEEAQRGRTRQEKREISIRNVLRARTSQPTQEPRTPKWAFPPVVVESMPATPKRAPGRPSREQTEVELEDVLAEERVRSNLPWSGGGPWRKWEMAVSLLEKIQISSFSPEIAALNAVITACARAQELAQCKLVLDTMKGESVQPDAVTCAQLIGGCCQRGLWEQALLILGRARDLSVASMSTCEEGLKACFRGRQPRLALLLLAEMDRMPTGVSTPAINTAIATCARFGLWTQAIALLSELQSRLMTPSFATYAAAAAACDAAPSLAWEQALLLLEESQRLGLASDETDRKSVV